MGGTSRAARRKRHRRALIMSGLRKLFAASAMTTVVRAIIGQSQAVGDHFTDRLAERAKRGIEIGVRRIVLYLVAGALFAVAAGFLIAAGYMGLTLLVSPPIAGLIVALVLALAGGGTLLFGRLDHEEETEAETHEASAEASPEAATSPGETAAEGTDQSPDSEQASMTVLLMGLFDSLLKYAGRNLGLVAAVLFLVALWFGLGADDREDDDLDADEDEERDAARTRPEPPKGFREPAATGA